MTYLCFDIIFTETVTVKKHLNLAMNKIRIVRLPISIFYTFLQTVPSKDCFPVFRRLRVRC